MKVKHSDCSGLSHITDGLWCQHLRSQL